MTSMYNEPSFYNGNTNNRYHSRHSTKYNEENPEMDLQHYYNLSDNHNSPYSPNLRDTPTFSPLSDHNHYEEKNTIFSIKEEPSILSSPQSRPSSIDYSYHNPSPSDLPPAFENQLYPTYDPTSTVYSSTQPNFSNPHYSDVSTLDPSLKLESPVSHHTVSSYTPSYTSSLPEQHHMINSELQLPADPYTNNYAHHYITSNAHMYLDPSLNGNMVVPMAYNTQISPVPSYSAEIPQTYSPSSSVSVSTVDSAVDSAVDSKNHNHGVTMNTRSSTRRAAQAQTQFSANSQSSEGGPAKVTRKRTAAFKSSRHKTALDRSPSSENSSDNDDDDAKSPDNANLVANSFEVKKALAEATDRTPVNLVVDGDCDDADIKKQRNKYSASQYRKRRKLFVEILEIKVAEMELELKKANERIAELEGRLEEKNTTAPYVYPHPLSLSSSLPYYPSPLSNVPSNVSAGLNNVAVNTAVPHISQNNGMYQVVSTTPLTPDQLQQLQPMQPMPMNMAPVAAVSQPVSPNPYSYNYSNYIAQQSYQYPSPPPSANYMPNYAPSAVYPGSSPTSPIGNVPNVQYPSPPTTTAPYSTPPAATATIVDEESSSISRGATRASVLFAFFACLMLVVLPPLYDNDQFDAIPGMKGASIATYIGAPEFEIDLNLDFDHEVRQVQHFGRQILSLNFKSSWELATSLSRSIFTRAITSTQNFVIDYLGVPRSQPYLVWVVMSVLMGTLTLLYAYWIKHRYISVLPEAYEDAQANKIDNQGVHVQLEEAALDQSGLHMGRPHAMQYSRLHPFTHVPVYPGYRHHHPHVYQFRPQSPIMPQSMPLVSHYPYSLDHHQMQLHAARLHQRRLEVQELQLQKHIQQYKIQYQQYQSQLQHSRLNQSHTRSTKTNPPSSLLSPGSKSRSTRNKSSRGQTRVEFLIPSLDHFNSALGFSESDCEDSDTDLDTDVDTDVVLSSSLTGTDKDTLHSPLDTLPSPLPSPLQGPVITISDVIVISDDSNPLLADDANVTVEDVTVEDATVKGVIVEDATVEDE